MKPVAWSYTALVAFETCGYRFYRTKVAKDIPDPPGEAAVWGQRVHKALELRVGKGTPLPDGMKQWEPLAARFANTPGKVFVEHQIALDKNFRPTTWFAKDVWVRGVVDVGVDRGEKCVAADWKTGKRKPDSEQMMLFAGLIMHAKPKINVVSTSFVWLPDKKLDKAVYTRDDIPMIWQEFTPRVQRLEQAHATGKWQKKPSGLCARWCPLTRAQCEFSGRD